MVIIKYARSSHAIGTRLLNFQQEEEGFDFYIFAKNQLKNESSCFPKYQILTIFFILYLKIEKNLVRPECEK